MHSDEKINDVSKAIASATKYTYVIRTCDAQMNSHNGHRLLLDFEDDTTEAPVAKSIQWPTRGVIECDDWDPNPKNGHGLHGFLLGVGNSAFADWTIGIDFSQYRIGDDNEPQTKCENLISGKPYWLLVKVAIDDLVVFDGGGVKFPRGEVILTSQDRFEVLSKLEELAPEARYMPVMGCVRRSADNSMIVGGDRCELQAGNNSVLKGGDRCRLHGGDFCVLMGGHCSVFSAGNDSNVTGGNDSNITGGFRCVLIGGNHSHVRAYRNSTLVGGTDSTLTGDETCSMSGGVGTEFNFSINKKNVKKLVPKKFRVDGEKIKANVAYSLRNGKLIETSTLTET